MLKEGQAEGTFDSLGDVWGLKRVLGNENAHQYTTPFSRSTLIAGIERVLVLVAVLVDFVRSECHGSGDRGISLTSRGLRVSVCSGRLRQSGSPGNRRDAIPRPIFIRDFHSLATLSF